MADIAEIGFGADTAGLVDAKNKLDALPPAAGRAERAADALNRILGGVGGQAGIAGIALGKFKAANDNVVGSIGKGTAALNLFKLALTGIGALLGTIIAGMGIGAYARLADTWSDLSSRVGLAVGNMEAAPQVMKRLSDMADATYSSLQNTVEGFIGVSASMKELGYNTNQTLDYVEAVNNALVISGAKGQRAESVLNALGKSMALGKLSGENLNTVIASGGKIAEALAAELNTTTGGLLKMGAAGKITGDVIYNALTKRLDELRILAGEMPATIEDGFIIIGNGVLNLVGKFDQLTGISAFVAEKMVEIGRGIKWVSDNLPMLIAGATQAATALALVFGPAIIAGAVSLTAYVIGLNIAIGVGLVNALLGAALAMQTFMFSNPFTAIIQAVFLALAAIYVFRDSVNDVFGADITGIVKTAGNTIIQVLHGVFETGKFIFSNLPAVVGAAIIGAVNVVIAAVEKMVQAGAAAVNAFIAIGNKARDLFGYDAWEFIMPELPRIENNPLTELQREGVALKETLNGISETDYLGNLGTAITGMTEKLTGANVEAINLNNSISAIGTGGDAGKGGGKGKKDPFQEIINGAEKTLATLQAERDAVGLNELAAAKLRRETELLNQAKEKNISLSPQQRAQLIGLAHDMANLEVETKKAKEALDFARDTTKGFLSDLKNGLMQGQSFWEAFGNAAIGVLNKIADKLLDDVLNAIFEVSSAAGGASGGGWLGSLLGGIGKIFGFAKGGTFAKGINGHSNTIVDKPTMFAFASGAGIMGEAGAEAIMPLKRGPDGSLGVQMHGGDKAANGDTHITYAPSYTVEAGATQEAVAELRKVQAEDRRNFKNNVEDAIGDLRMRGSDV